MKFLILLFPILAAFHLADGPGFYGIKFNNINGEPVNTSSCQGKKVIVALLGVNPASLDEVNYLDSVQRANTDFRVFAVPTGDFGGNITHSDLINLQKRLKLVITEPLKVKRISGPLQHPFFAWLTNVAQNKHFNIDADEEGRVFIISGKGTLYSVLGRQTPKAAFNKIINQPFND